MLGFFVEHTDFTTEAIAIAAVFLIVSLTERLHVTWLRTIEWGLGRIAQHRGVSLMFVGLLALGASATLSLVGHMPEPAVHDEFSYLLAADTFAHGRLSNPAHPQWMNFESFHIIQQPTYASKFPPAQGLMLAAGQVLGGHPIVGVWISTALAGAAIYWMLLAWSPPGWALLGAIITILHPGILIEWGQSYWGGAVAIIGGALVFGALRRIARQPCTRDSVALAVGLAILANSRPYEGLLVSLPVAAVLLAWMLKKSSPTAHVLIRRVVLPIFVVLLVTGAAMGFYNWRVSGSALRLPYEVYEATYSVLPIFRWQDLPAKPKYRNEIMRRFYTRPGMFGKYTEPRSIMGLVTASAEKFKRLWFFYQRDRRLGLALTIPLLMLPWVARQRWSRFALLTGGVCMAGVAMETFTLPHYVAPITSLVVVIWVQGMRYLRVWRWPSRSTGRWLVWALVVVALWSFGVEFADKLRQKPYGFEFERARIVQHLQAEGGRHLIVVRYGPLHLPQAEWVYNAADIDGAPVVWARETDQAQMCQLLNYFKSRYFWLLEVDQGPAPPTLYRATSAHDYLCWSDEKAGGERPR